MRSATARHPTVVPNLCGFGDVHRRFRSGGPPSTRPANVAQSPKAKPCKPGLHRMREAVQFANLPVESHRLDAESKLNAPHRLPRSRLRHVWDGWGKGVTAPLEERRHWPRTIGGVWFQCAQCRTVRSLPCAIDWTPARSSFRESQAANRGAVAFDPARRGLGVAHRRRQPSSTR